jgi:pilus assembly protein FimV
MDLTLPVDEMDDGTVLQFAPPTDDMLGSSDEAAKLASELDLDSEFTLDSVDGETEAVSLQAQHDADDFDVEAVADYAELEPEPVSEAELGLAPVGIRPSSRAANEAGEDLDFLSDSDETSTKLDLARAYIDMGDREGARDILDEVLLEGDADQQSEARNLMAQLG